MGQTALSHARTDDLTGSPSWLRPDAILAPGPTSARADPPTDVPWSVTMIINLTTQNQSNLTRSAVGGLADDLIHS